MPQGEIAVGTTPAPVEMQQVVVVVAITHEGMAALAAFTSIEYGSLQVKTGFQHRNPFFVTEITSLF